MTSLLLLILLPLAAAGLVIAAPPAKARGIALIGTLVPVGWFIFLAAQPTYFDWTLGKTDQLSYPAYEWFPALGIKLSLGAEPVTMLLMGLTVLLGPICVLSSWTAITDRPRTYYGWLLVLQAAMTGVFAARDIVLFYIFFEFTLVPLYVLINLYGSTNRKAAATKFFLFTFTGSIITLAALVYVAWRHADASGAWTMDMGTLALTARGLPLREQSWVFLGLMAGFAIKVPLFPVHTWLPLAHTEAPTAGSVILAGVLLKLGTYGIYRFGLGYTPDAALYYAPAVAVLAIIGILYAGLICWVQTDVKKLVAYSSVSHLGFCILGMFAFNAIGITGSVLYMINHGLSTGALFLLVGMIYERYHTRSMKEMGGLAARMPIWATFMVFFTMASVGLPGLNGFVSEFMCLLGAFQAGDVWADKGVAAGVGGKLGPWFAFIAGIGMIITAIYLLYMLGRVVWGKLVEPAGHASQHAHENGKGAPHAASEGHSALPPDLNWREIGLLLPLAALCLWLGLYPTPVLRALEDPARDMARLGQASLRAERERPPEPTDQPGPGERSEPHSAAGESPATHQETTR